MVQALRNKLKNQKGFTLIELLAVIVILGILAAIAIPSIMGIINNSKKDAQVANAQQMVSGAKNAVASNDDAISWSTDGLTGTLTLANEVSKGYLDNFKNPDTNTNNYDTANSKVVIEKTAGTNDIKYYVTLKSTAPHTYLDGTVEAGDLKRSSIQ